MVSEIHGTAAWNVKSEDGQRMYVVTEVNSECKNDCFFEVP